MFLLLPVVGGLCHIDLSKQMHSSCQELVVEGIKNILNKKNLVLDKLSSVLNA